MVLKFKIRKNTSINISYISFVSIGSHYLCQESCHRIICNKKGHNKRMMEYGDNSFKWSRLISLLDLPTCNTKWEDFWDFSRMSAPEWKWCVIVQRCKYSSKRMIGNYVWIWMIAILFLSLVLQKYSLSITLFVTFAWWCFLSLMTVSSPIQSNNNSFHFQPKSANKNVVTTDERVSIFATLCVS